MDRRAFFVAFATACVVLIGFWRIDHGLRSEQQELARTQFTINASRASDIVSDRVRKVLNLLNDSGRVVGQSIKTTGTATAMFDRLVRDGAILQRHPEMDAIAFMRMTSTADAVALAQEVNADPDRALNGHGPFVPRPPTTLDRRVMVKLIYPLTLSERMSGFDLMTTPRRLTLERAMLRGGPSASDRLLLFGDRPGVVIYQPVYGQVGDETPLGFIGTGFVTDIFLYNLRDLLAPLGVDIAVFDRGIVEVARAPMSEASRLGRFEINPGAPQTAAISDDPRSVFKDIRVADRIWTIAVRPAAVTAADWQPNMNLALGTLIAALIGILIYVTRRDRGRLACIVAQRTRDLRSALQELEEKNATTQHQAVHDDLTGLLNRRGLHEGLRMLLKMQDLTVISFDLDGFKALNDTRGHVFGDRALQIFAEKLKELSPAGSLIARMGGDEFVVALKAGTADESDKLIDELLKWVAQPMQISGQQVRLGSSIGVAESTISGREVSALLADADVALYLAKDAGKNQVALCTPELRSTHNARQTMSEELRDGLADDQLDILFQTQHASDDHRIIGAEALVRWRHPEKGMVSPAAFLPLAEDLGLMAEVDAAVLNKSIACLQELDAADIALPKLNVNVSYARLTDPGLQSLVAHLPQTKTKLVFEIVEAVLLDDRRDLDAWQLDAIRDKGIGIELDDFGTGHASVVALTQLRPDRMKLDRKFVAPLPDPAHEQLVAAILSMGRTLNIPMTAEGVETEAQACVLRDLGIDAFQGYLFGRPMSFDALKSMLKDTQIQRRAAG